MRNKDLDIVRCIMNYMIVVMHAWAAFQYVPWTTWEFKAWTFICEFVCHSVMPTFFLISGYLLFKGYAWNKVAEKMTRRLRRLLVPYVVWNVSFVAFYVTACHFVPRLAARVETFGLMSFAGALSKILSFTVPPIDGPLWFLRALLYLVLASPLIWLGLRFLRGIPLLALAILWVPLEFFCGVHQLSGTVLPSYGICCFVAGGVFAVQGKDLVCAFKNWIWVLVGVVACVIRGLWSVPSYMSTSNNPVWMSYCSGFLFLLEAPALIALVSCLKLGQWRFFRSRFYEYLRDMSFFAYAGHFLFCSIFLHSLAPKFGFMTTGKMTVLVLAFVGLGVPTMAVVYGAARRVCPKALKLWDGTL